MKTIKNSFYYIGCSEIYKEQEECAEKILKIFEKNGGPPILIAQPQEGKTGVSIAVINKFINNCKSQSLKYEIIYLVNLSDNELKEQSETRLKEAGLLNDVTIIHHANLKTLILNKKIDRRLIIIDECHIALDASTKENIKPFDNFLKKCGADYGKSINNWKNKNNYILSVSATPYAAAIREKIDNNSFESVILEKSKNYFSLLDIYKKERLYQSEKLTDKKTGKVTEFLEERFEEFLYLCETEGNGHLIIRCIGDAPDIIKNYIKDISLNIDVEIYGSGKNDKNISSLDNYLSKKFPKPSVAIIKGSLRAGKTLTNTKFIRMWLEPSGSKTDTVTQVIGRCLGYESKDEYKHSKFNDTFPIYCNLDEIEIAINFYSQYYNNSNLFVVPSSRRTKATNGKTINFEENYLFSNSSKEAKEKISKEFNIPANKITLVNISKNNPNNWAESIANNTRHGGGEYRIFHLDGPNLNDKNHISSWSKLMKEKPYLRPKGEFKAFVYYKRNSEAQEDYTKNLKKGQIFNK